MKKFMVSEAGSQEVISRRCGNSRAAYSHHVLFLVLVLTIVVLSVGEGSSLTAQQFINYMDRSVVNKSIEFRTSNFGISYNDSFENITNTWRIKNAATTSIARAGVSSNPKDKTNTLNWSYNVTSSESWIEDNSTVSLGYGFGYLNLSNASGLGIWVYSYPTQNETLRLLLRIGSKSTTGAINVEYSNILSQPLNFSGWKYIYWDLRGISDLNLNESSIQNISAIRFIINGTSTGNVLFDKLEFLDLYKGALGYPDRWQLQSSNGWRNMELLGQLSYLFSNETSGWYNNVTINNYVINAMDMIQQTQIPFYDDWLSNQSNIAGRNFIVASGIGSSFALAYRNLINNNSVNLSTIVILNNQTNSRSGFYNITLNNLGEYYIARMPIPSEYATTYVSNQYLLGQLAMWLNYNITLNSSIFTQYNNNLQIIASNQTIFGVLPEHNSVINVQNNSWFSANYTSTQYSILCSLILETKNKTYIDIVKNMEQLLLNNIITDGKLNGLNSSRNDGDPYAVEKWSIPACYTVAVNYNLTYLKQASYLAFIYNENEYLNLNDTSYPWRHLTYYSHLFFTSPQNQSFLFPAQHNKFYYDLFNLTNGFTKRILDTNTLGRATYEMPNMTFAYNDNNTWWINRDNLRTNITGWIYEDSNGNFTIPVIPKIRINFFNNIIEILSQNNANPINSTSNLLVNITPNSIILKAFSKFEVYNLNNALIWNTNGSIYSNTNLKNNDGNINFSQGSNNYSYVLDNFNLTESIPRANSPIWINSHDLTKNQNENIHIASNLTDTISNFTVNVNVDDCVNIKSVTLTPNGMSAYTPSYTCDSTTKTLTIIDPIITQSAMSNVISIIYNLPQLNSFCSTIIGQNFGGFFGSMSMIFTILGVAILIGILFFVFMAVNGKGTNIDASAMSDLFEKFDIKMVLILVLGIGIFIFLIMTVFGALCS